MGARRIRREQRRFDQNLSRRLNGMKKDDERERRKKRFVELLKKGKFPYTPTIRNWICETLGKPFTRVSEADVKTLIGA